MAPREDPEEKCGQAGDQARKSGNIDPPDPVACQANEWPADALRHCDITDAESAGGNRSFPTLVAGLTVEHGGGERSLACRETDLLGVVGDGEDNDDIAHEGEESPADEQPVVEQTEDVLVEGDGDGTDRLVPVSHNQAAAAVHDEGDDGQDPERPGQAEVRDHGVGAQRVNETAKTGAAGGHRISEGASLDEPLGDHADCGGEAKAQAQTEAHTLAEEKMPDVGGKRGANEGGAGKQKRTACMSASCCRLSRGLVGGEGGSAYASNTTPTRRQNEVPNRPMHQVTKGDTSNASQKGDSQRSSL